MFDPEKRSISYENKSEEEQEKLEKFKKIVGNWLTLPEKAKEENPDEDLPKKLGDFLVEKKVINKIDAWRGSWGFKYEEGTIYISENPIPENAKNYYIFRMPSELSDGREVNLFPEKEKEIDVYRFLHETSHAYQEYLMKKESPDDPGRWYGRALSEGDSKIDSNLGLLFEFCKEKREQNAGESEKEKKDYQRGAMFLITMK